MSWLARWQQRQNEIARGADADLFRANARPYRWAAVLLASAFVLNWLNSKLHFPHVLRVLVMVLAVLSLLASSILFRWARAERSWLIKPDPEQTPSILKD